MILLPRQMAVLEHFAPIGLVVGHGLATQGPILHYLLYSSINIGASREPSAWRGTLY
jgi:hypothetical protein